MTSPENITEKLETLYKHVESERMQGIPIVNPRLNVKAVGVQEWGEYWFGVMLTPWFMNLILLPKDESSCDWSNDPVGSKVSFNFPAGTFEFIVSHESAIGRFLMSSLFSPVLEFGDQETAEKTAEVVLTEIFKSEDEDEVDPRDEEMQQIWKGEKPAPEHVEAADKDLEHAGADQEERSETPETLSRRDLIKGLNKTGERNAT